MSVDAISSLYETGAVGPPQAAYLNAAIRGSYFGVPTALLARLLELERSHGRARRERWGPRTLDLDILWIRGREVSLPDLRIPHPHLAERRFALAPLLDVAPDAADPRTGEPYRTVLDALPPAEIVRLEGPGWAGVAIRAAR